MSYRNITIGSTAKSGINVISSDATNWGSLKDALRSTYGDLEKMRAVIRETRNDLTSDDALLPEDAFTLLLTPKQIKAGASQVDVVAVLEDVRERFSAGIDEIIDGVTSGDYNLASSKLSSVKTKTATSADSLARDLEDLKNGRL